MTIKQTLAFSLLAFSLSTGIALAAELPANVKSLQSQRSGGEITVLWSQVPGAVSYRVYFSQKSILANAGNYDDFEQTTDAQTVYVFKTAPLKSGKI